MTAPVPNPAPDAVAERDAILDHLERLAEKSDAIALAAAKMEVDRHAAESDRAQAYLDEAVDTPGAEKRIQAAKATLTKLDALAIDLDRRSSALAKVRRAATRKIEATILADPDAFVRHAVPATEAADEAIADLKVAIAKAKDAVSIAAAAWRPLSDVCGAGYVENDQALTALRNAAEMLRTRPGNVRDTDDLHDLKLVVWENHSGLRKAFAADHDIGATNRKGQPNLVLNGAAGWFVRHGDPVLPDGAAPPFRSAAEAV